MTPYQCHYLKQHLEQRLPLLDNYVSHIRNYIISLFGLFKYALFMSLLLDYKCRGC